jgi:3-phenylpropionate/trans-cinnamate dioxygenase ferredoxin reductase subunit
MDRIVIIGAGVAGISAAEHLRVLGYDGRLTVLSAEDRLPYDRPPLSKEFLLSPGTPVDLRPEAWYTEHGVDLRLRSPATAIRPTAGEVEVAAGPPLPADAVLLATGGRPRRLSVPGGDHPSVLVLRTLADAETLRDRLRPGVRLAVVGAGLIGAEVTANAVALGCQVTLIDPMVRPLEPVLGPELAELLQQQHREHGVRIVTGAVSSIEDGHHDIRLRLDDGHDAVDADVVVVGVGIVYETALAAGAGLRTNGAVLVDEGQRTSVPSVYAAGDLTQIIGPAGPRPRAEHWDAAVHEGRTAAAAMLGRPGPAARAPWFWSARYGGQIEVLGDFAGRSDTIYRGDLGNSAFVVIGVRAGRVVGAVGWNRSAEIAALRRLIGRADPVNLDGLADESAELRSVVRTILRDP